MILPRFCVHVWVHAYMQRRYLKEKVTNGDFYLFVFSIWFKCLLYISIILGLRKYNKVVFSVIQSIRNTQITYVSSPPVKTFFFLSVVYLLEVGTELIKLIYANWWIISISIILQDIFIFLKYKWISKWYSR